MFNPSQTEQSVLQNNINQRVGISMFPTVTQTTSNISNNSNTSNNNNNNNQRSIFNGKFMHSLPLPHSGQLKDTQRNFINTPSEYTNRARDEIKQLVVPHPQGQARGQHGSTTTSQLSVYSSDISSYQSSIFSRPSLPNNNNSNSNNNIGAGSIYSNDDNINNNNNSKPALGNNPHGSISLPPLNFVTEISLQDALPQSYQDMYSPETLRTSALLPNGRPRFTQRALIDWEFNDLRSLLIVDKLRPEWGNSIPVVIPPSNEIQLRIILMPLVCNENVIIETLVSSDIYMEAFLDLEFKRSTAKYIVDQVKRKHRDLNILIDNNGNNNDNGNSILRLSKIEWRNIIENYLLNIAVGVQCRFDFRQRCSDFKKWKIDNSIKQQQQQQQNDDDDLVSKARIVLTKDEKSILWSQCQAQVYQRLGLDWKPDQV